MQKSEQQVRAALKHLREAHEGAMTASTPPPSGARMEGDKVAAEALRRENRAKAEVIARMMDALHWSLGDPSELAQWIERWNRMDELAKNVPPGRLSA